MKLAECEKTIKRINFEKAIAVDDPPSPSEGLEIDKMGKESFNSMESLSSVMLIYVAVVEDSYDGARLAEGVDMTPEFITDMIERFKNGKKLHKKFVYHIIVKAKDTFKAEPTMPDITVNKGNKLTICGDTHGKLSPKVKNLKPY